MTESRRTFTLINSKWDEPHHLIFLIEQWARFKYPLKNITDHNLDKKKVNPIYWIWEEDKINRSAVAIKDSSKNKKMNKFKLLISK